jgi:hypothetical protein
MEPSRRHRIVLIETSEALCREVGDFFAKSAPQLDLRTFGSAADVDGLVSGADSVLIGPEPGVDLGNDKSTSGLTTIAPPCLSHDRRCC